MRYFILDDFRYGNLRALNDRDVDGMLEWMHDSEIAGVFSTRFIDIDRNSALEFIAATHAPSDSLHFGIAGAHDEYLGTISLKHIDRQSKRAEYAIATRRCAHGTGIAALATRDVIRYAFDELHLNEVYLCVRGSNKRAVAFYRKIGFKPMPQEAESNDDGLLWFSCSKEGA